MGLVVGMRGKNRIKASPPRLGELSCILTID